MQIPEFQQILKAVGSETGQAIKQLVDAEVERRVAIEVAKLVKQARTKAAKLVKQAGPGPVDFGADQGLVDIGLRMAKRANRSRGFEQN